MGRRGRPPITNRVQVLAEPAEQVLPVSGDPIQLQQVLLNLMLNAFEAMQTTALGSRVLEISTARDEGAGVARITVRDAGTGISPAVLETVLEPFVSTKEQGLGMGLAISRSIIETHGGCLHAANNPEAGACFTVTIPMAETGRS